MKRFSHVRCRSLAPGEEEVVSDTPPLLVDGFEEGPAGLRYTRAAKTAAKHCLDELSSAQTSIKSLVSDLSSRQSSEELKDEVAEAENKFDLLKKFLAAACDINCSTSGDKSK